MPPFDVVGVGLNATDTLILLPHFPPYGGKAPFRARSPEPGRTSGERDGHLLQPGSARKIYRHAGRRPTRRAFSWKACARAASTWTTSRSARIARTKAPTSWLTRPQANARCSGIGTNACASIADSLTADKIACARLLHIDGHDTPAVSRAAEIARRHQIPVSVDVDTIYPGFERVLPNVDYLVASSEFPARWTQETRSVSSLGHDPG